MHHLLYNASSVVIFKCFFIQLTNVVHFLPYLSILGSNGTDQFNVAGIFKIKASLQKAGEIISRLWSIQVNH